MTSNELLTLVQDALDDLKAQDIVTLDVQNLTNMTDYLVIATGTSSRHVSSLAEHVELEAKKAGTRALGVEGKDTGEWVLVDFADLVVHVMQPDTRTFYDLESLWSGLEDEASNPAQ